MDLDLMREVNRSQFCTFTHCTPYDIPCHHIHRYPYATTATIHTHLFFQRMSCQADNFELESRRWGDSGFGDGDSWLGSSLISLAMSIDPWGSVLILSYVSHYLYYNYFEILWEKVIANVKGIKREDISE